jgi:hypothetical protein
MFSRALALAIFLAAGFMAASCATDSYHAYEAGEGYSEERLASTRWRISFAGSTVESQSAVEAQLLRRAAELTVQSGHQWFVADDQAVQQEEDIVVTGERTPAPGVDSTQSVWRPRWRRRSASRWTDWDPQGALPMPDAPQAPPANTATQTRFSAVAEIRMGSGAMPAEAFDARAVLASATDRQ